MSVCLGLSNRGSPKFVHAMHVNKSTYRTNKSSIQELRTTAQRTIMVLGAGVLFAVGCANATGTPWELDETDSDDSGTGGMMPPDALTPTTTVPDDRMAPGGTGGTQSSEPAPGSGGASDPGGTGAGGMTGPTPGSGGEDMGLGCGSLSDCDGECVDLANDKTNCGACGTGCRGNQACLSGVCGCDPGAELCEEMCIDPDSDPNNCGECGAACGGDTPFCAQGSCAACPNLDQTSCNGLCVDLLSDTQHCGACGTVCNTDEEQVCHQGTCLTPGGCALPDAESYESAACGETAVFNGALYECLSSNRGECGEPSVYCQALTPDFPHWGAVAWEYIRECE